MTATLLKHVAVKTRNELSDFFGIFNVHLVVKFIPRQSSDETELATFTLATNMAACCSQYSLWFLPVIRPVAQFEILLLFSGTMRVKNVCVQEVRSMQHY